MPDETKECESCGAKVGKSEKVCPACKLDFDELEDNLKNLDLLDKVRDSRKKKASTPTTTVTATVTVKKKLFGGLVKRG